MRFALIAVLVISSASSARAHDPFELQCSKAFDNIAETRAGSSWEGANKARFCRCMRRVFAGSADRLEDYSRQPIKGGPLAAGEWSCYEASDLTTKGRR